jgi:glycine dehydrogenase subunit 1
MGSYLPNTGDSRREMLARIGRDSVEELFSVVPEKVRSPELSLPPGMAELELAREIGGLAAENRVFPRIFRGAGAYHHYIPGAVKRICANETFLTAYTPYQAEISQGILQSIFEYQTMICELTGMDLANASAYDGASAAAEGVNMCRDRARETVYVSAAAHPQTIQTIETYCGAYGAPVVIVPAGEDGRTGAEALAGLLAEEGAAGRAACLYIQSPNFFGLMEDLPRFAEAIHDAGALLVAGVNPISLGICESPGALGADIAVGEGQPLGLPLAFGGPYLGFMASKSALMRRLPGRIVGETTDAGGRRAFVLTLQAREQHIRREKASSNLCSNQAHSALTAAVYLSVMGEEGFAELSRQCHAKAVYAAGRISSLPGYSLVYGGEFFNEFVTRCPDTEKTLALLESRDILGGYPLARDRILWCVTELNRKADIDELAAILKEGIG